MKNKSEKFLEAVGDNDWSVILEPGSVFSYMDLSHFDMDALMEYAAENGINFSPYNKQSMKKLIQVTDMGDNYGDVNMYWPSIELDKKNQLIVLSSAYGWDSGESQMFCTKVVVRK